MATPEATERHAVHSNFVNRIVGLPVIATALGTATNSYNRVKSSNGLLCYTLNAAERSAAFATERTVPVLEKLAGPIQYVDYLACKGLDKVEESYPVVKRPPEQIMADALAFGRKKCDEAKVSGIMKVNTLKNYSSAKLQALTHPPQMLTEYGSQLMKYADQALIAAEDSLDQHIVSLGFDVDNSYENTNEVPLKRRFDNISRKARSCVSHHAAMQLVAMQKYATDSLAKFQVALQVIHEMRANVNASNQSFQTMLSNLNVGSSWLQGLLADAKTSPDVQKTLPVQALTVAHSAIKHLAATLQVPGYLVQHMSTSVRNSYARLVLGASQLAENVTTVDNVNNLTTSTILRLQEQAASLQASLHQFTASGFNWLASLPVFDGILRPMTEMESIPPGTRVYSSEDDSDIDS